MQTVMETFPLQPVPSAIQGKARGLHDALDEEVRAFLKHLVIALIAFAIAAAL